MASVIGRLRANVRKSPMGGTPGGIIAANRWPTSGSYGGLSGAILAVSFFEIMAASMLRKPKLDKEVVMAARREPRPGAPVRGSRTCRPVMAALDLLGRRWALRILWELRAGPVGARSLRERCDAMSSSVLYERLDELTTAGLVTRSEDAGYALTDLGTSLGEALGPLDAWARAWAKRR